VGLVSEQIGFLGHLHVAQLRYAHFLDVSLVDVDGQQDTADSHLRRSEVEEPRVIELELAELETHVVHCPVEVVTQDTEEPLHAGHGVREVEFELKFHQDLRFQVSQGLFCYSLGLLFL